ncbi:MAG: hypothetical protein JNM95_11210 [Chitinophagaceae bacterium]|nr:hypothetical protein [Chitinophagaceae bacterium]
MKHYDSHVVALANEVAEKLGDKESINAYLQICEQYNEAHVRKILEKVQSIPIREIRKTPGALFTFLIRNHARRVHPWD